MLNSPGGSDSKESAACNAGDLGSIPGLGKSPGGGNGNPFQYSCLEKPHRQRSLAGYSPRAHKETEQLKRKKISKMIQEVKNISSGCLGSTKYVNSNNSCLYKVKNMDSGVRLVG